jgi:hypothetical protein
MDGKIIIYALFILSVLGGVAGILYTTDVDEAQKDLILTRQQLGQAEESLKQANEVFAQRKEAVAIITAAHIIDHDNETLRTEISGLQKKREEMNRTFAATIQRVRETSVGLVLPEICLTTGNTLRNAKIQALNHDLTVIQHTDGVSKVPTESLPNTLLDRFRFSNAPARPGAPIETVPDKPTLRQPETKPNQSPGPRSSESYSFPSNTSDAIARLGEGGPAKSAQAAPAAVPNPTSNDPRTMEIEGDPALWQSVERQSVGRAYIPGQGWLKIGSKGPIPGSGRK